jgi:DNA-binding GntR family transcriptional regulator
MYNSAPAGRQCAPVAPQFKPDGALEKAMTPRDAAESGEQQRRNDEDEIVRRIHNAVIEQRLRPGTKLSEAALCETFGVGRAKVRRSLLVLAGRDIVELHANRGAFVAQPTAEQARDVFDARRAIEPGIVHRAIAQSDERDLDRLAEHLRAETNARGHRDRRHAIRLSGHFHVILAEIAGNRILERVVGELVTRTSLIIGMFGEPGTDNCHVDEHERILEAIRAGDGDIGETLILEHLAHIEAELDMSGKRLEAVNLIEVLGSGT